MTEFVSRKYGQEDYEVIIRTDSELHQRVAENFARRLIGHEKPEEAVKCANWTHVRDFGEGKCYGRCGNCFTALRARDIPTLLREYRYCRWCGAKLMPEPVKGETADV